MKYKVKVDDRLFEVEVQDIHTRPVVAVVDGVPIEVWPQAEQLSRAEQDEIDTAAQPRDRLQAAPAKPANAPNGAGKSVLSPIPGVIVSIEVQPGAQVKVGDPLVVLEAMKMKNTIRASRAGVIGAIAVKIGQHVRHHDLLLEFEE